MDVGLMQAWLRGGRAYQQGVDLLAASGLATDDELFLLELGETSVSRAHLVRCMERVVAAEIRTAKSLRTVTREVVTKADIAEELRQVTRDPRKDGYQDTVLPPALYELREQARAHLKEMAHLRSRMELLPSDLDRYRDAGRIVHLDTSIASIYGRLDAWKATGRDPGTISEDPAVEKSIVELMKELRNLGSYLARRNTGARKADAKKVEQWERRKREIEELLNAV